MKTTVLNSISTLLGIVFSGIALINLFLATTLFMVFLFCCFHCFLSLLFNATKSKDKTYHSFWVKGLLALFILWTSLGVAELPAKIQMMLEYFK